MDNLLHFPTTTLVDKNVPKNAFYGRSSDTHLRDFLTHEFESITWLYKLAPATLNVEDGELVHEIDVFVCRMKEEYYSINPFCGMDKLLPRHTLFIIFYGDKVDLLMHHKEVTRVQGEEKWKCDMTELQRNVHLDTDLLQIEGQNMDAVYHALLRQISGLNISNEEEYKEQTDLRKRIEALKKQIATLQKKIRSEKQFNRQVELNAETRQLKKALQELGNKLNAK